VNCFKGTIRYLWLLPVLGWLAFAGAARAHDIGLSIATVRLQTNHLQVALAFALRETRLLAPLDTDHDGFVSTNEFIAGQDKLVTVVREKCLVRFDAIPGLVTNTFSGLAEGDRVDVVFDYIVPRCHELQLQFEVIKHLRLGHRMFFTFVKDGATMAADRLLEAHDHTVSFVVEVAEQPVAGPPPVAESATRRTFFDFVKLGVEHIGTGYDHLLFLFGLLIVTRTFKAAFQVITAFTLAHSLTLAVATLDWFVLPARYTEPLIAVSIAYVGVENLVRRGEPQGRWLLTFAFGLIHGFGFASILRDLGVGNTVGSVALPLLSFNLGVELGQIAVAAVALPVIWKLRTKTAFVRYWVPACSVAVTLAGTYWFVQRVWF